MDITYETIIKYLVHSNKSESDFPTKKNLMRYHKFFPDEFNDRLTNKFYRYGIQVYDLEQNNISFWSSVLHLLNKKFILMDKYEQIDYIKSVKNQMIEYLDNNYIDFKLKSKFSKSVAKEYILKNTFSPLLIELLSYIFDINIITFNFEKKEIYITHSNTYSNPWRPIIILANYKDFWEPICSEDKKIFNYNNIVIKKLLNSQIEYFANDYLDKDYNLLDNIYEIIKLEKGDTDELDISSEMTEVNENNTFVNKNILSQNLTKSKLNKMKKDQIMKLIDDLKLDVNQKRPTKKNLIDIILNN